MSLTHLVLLRHGLTDWNAQGRIQGYADEPLNDLGRRQARGAAEVLRSHQLGAIYSSDLQRARVTAEIIGAPHSMEPALDERLREINCGVWEGKTWMEVNQDHPDIQDRYAAGIDFRRGETGETIAEMVERALPAAQEIVSAHPGQMVLVVAHGLLIQRLAQRLVGLDPAARILGSVGNTHTTTISFVGDRAWLASHNAPVAHAAEGATGINRGTSGLYR